MSLLKKTIGYKNLSKFYLKNRPLFLFIARKSIQIKKKPEPPRYNWNIVVTDVLNTITQTNKHKNGGNVCFIKRNYEILYKEKSQWHDTFLFKLGGNPIWWFQFLKPIDIVGELLICYSYRYFVQVNVLSYIKNLQFYSKSCKLTGVKYIMHLYKCTCMLKHLKSFIWFCYGMSFLDKS
jgi:hypothetical protein